MNYYKELVDLISAFDETSEVISIRYKRYSNSGGFWIEDKRLVYNHHINETLEYLENWYFEIQEINVYFKDSMRLKANYKPQTETKLIKNFSSKD